MKGKEGEKHERERRKISSASVMSIFAILISLLTFGINYYRQSGEDIRARKEEFRKILLTLMDLRYDFETTIFYMNEGAIKEKALSDNYAKIGRAHV